MNGNHFDWHDHIITSLLPSQYSSVLCHRSSVIVSILFHCLLFISSLFCLSSPLLPVTFDVFLLRRLCLCFCLVAASCCTLRRVLWNALSWEVSLSDCHTPSPELFMATDLSYRPLSLLSFLCGYCPLPTICHAILTAWWDCSELTFNWRMCYPGLGNTADMLWIIIVARVQCSCNNNNIDVVSQQGSLILDPAVAVGHPSPCIMCMLRRGKEPRVVAWLHLGMWHDALLSSCKALGNITWRQKF